VQNGQRYPFSGKAEQGQEPHNLQAMRQTDVPCLKEDMRLMWLWQEQAAARIWLAEEEANPAEINPFFVCPFGAHY